MGLMMTSASFQQSWVLSQCEFSNLFRFWKCYHIGHMEKWLADWLPCKIHFSQLQMLRTSSCWRTPLLFNWLIGCISSCLLSTVILKCFLKCFPWANSKSHWLHWLHFSPHCVFSCVLKESAWMDTGSHLMHLFDFSLPSVFKWPLKPLAQEYT